MAEMKITIPDDKVQLVLAAFAEMRGIQATPQAVKKEITDEIKDVVKRYKLQRLEQGRETSVSQADITVALG